MEWSRLLWYLPTLRFLWNLRLLSFNCLHLWNPLLPHFAVQAAEAIQVRHLCSLPLDACVWFLWILPGISGLPKREASLPFASSWKSYHLGSVSYNWLDYGFLLMCHVCEQEWDEEVDDWNHKLNQGWQLSFWMVILLGWNETSVLFRLSTQSFSVIREVGRCFCFG